MKTLISFTKRNIKLFFKDMGLFLVSLITPAILLILFVTFLGSVYENSFVSILEQFNITADDKIIKGMTGGQLVSSLLATSCVTVSFCSNMIMVQDKVYGMTNDFSVTPVKRPVMALSYYIATFLNTLIVCLFAMAICLTYLACVGWYLSFADVMLILLDVVLLTLFGTALSSVINFFLSSQGQISAVGSIVSSMYGFICGAYMPLSQLPEWLKTFVSFLPGTYGTSLLRNHCLQGALNELASSANVPGEVADAAVKAIGKGVDCTVQFAGSDVPQYAMFIILAGSVAVLIAVYVLLNKFVVKKKK